LSTLTSSFLVPRSGPRPALHAFPPRRSSDLGARVLALVREEAARALGLPAPDPVRPDEPLRDLGMDSVTAVDLRNRIGARVGARDRKSTRLNSSHVKSSYAVFCLKKKK